MTMQAIKRLIQVFGVLHLLAGVALILGAGYFVFLPSVRGGWLIFPWLFAVGVYFLWLGVRGYKSPSPRVVRQLCTTMFCVVATPFLVLVEYAGWDDNLLAVVIPAAVIVFGSFWLTVFGSRLFCRRLFLTKR